MSEKLPLDFEVVQEDDQVDGRRLLGVGVVGILVGAVGIFFGAVIVAATTGALQQNFAGPRGPRTPPVEISRIEQSPVGTAQRGIDLLDAQRRDLERWRWIDRKAGVAQIPIERAMDVVAGEGSR